MNDEEKAETRPPPFVVRTGYIHRPQPERFYDDGEDLGEGWSRPSVAVPAAALFPWLLKEDR